MRGEQDDWWHMAELLLGEHIHILFTGGKIGKVYGSCVHSCKMYGSETWPFKKLERTEMWMVRWMCGTSLREKKTSTEMRDRMGIKAIVGVLKGNRLRSCGEERKGGLGEEMHAYGGCKAERVVVRGGYEWYEEFEVNKYRCFGLSYLEEEDCRGTSWPMLSGASIGFFLRMSGHKMVSVTLEIELPAGGNFILDSSTFKVSSVLIWDSCLGRRTTQFCEISRIRKLHRWHKYSGTSEITLSAKEHWQNGVDSMFRWFNILK